MVFLILRKVAPFATRGLCGLKGITEKQHLNGLTNENSTN